MSTANNKISMEVKKFARGQTEQLSTVHRIGGYPWRLRFSTGFPQRTLSIICDKSDEAELWKCTAKIKIGPPLNVVRSHYFRSWNTNSQMFSVKKRITIGTIVEVEITPKEDGESWTRRSHLNPIEPRNGTLVVGEEKKKIRVNKEYLSSQSPFFDRLFNGDFKEKNMDEIPIKDVEYEELNNMIKLVCGERGACLMDGNVHRMLELSDRFIFKIVEDKVVSYLLSSSCSMAFQPKLLLSEQFGISILKNFLLRCNTAPQLLELCRSSDWDRLSEQTRKALFLATCGKDMSYSARNTFPDIRMFPPPAKKSKGSNTISMVVNSALNERDGSWERSPVHRINGFPWRLEIHHSDKHNIRVFLICDKSKEAELWQCTATVTLRTHRSFTDKFKFTSWGIQSNLIRELKSRPQIEVHIETEEDGESWTARPFVDPLEPHDVTLVIGEEKKRLTVDKKSLAMASPYFDGLFNGDSKEKNMDEIPIEDVTYEEFSNLIMIAYKREGASLTNQNLRNVLQLADKFELKIVQDYAISYLLNRNLCLSLSQQLIIAEEYRLGLLKAALLDKWHDQCELKNLCLSPDWNDIPKETIRVLFEKMCTRLR